MFIAPFGMLISKWAALKAFINANSVTSAASATSAKQVSGACRAARSASAPPALHAAADDGPDARSARCSHDDRGVGYGEFHAY